MGVDRWLFMGMDGWMGDGSVWGWMGDGSVWGRKASTDGWMDEGSVKTSVEPGAPARGSGPTPARGALAA